ncbi:MAG: TonB-dependent receptor [Steroidobacteraceae bacterium]|jgi:outer membrane receptor protein involved in Fe transport|nr:TonB-dependent receptor [Steroidobacteraceae bacterium]
MRIRGLTILFGSAWLACRAVAGDASPTEVVVTASKRAEARLDVPASITRLDADEIRLLGASHASEALNRVAGVMIQRGSGQESLTAIRSPVLSGPGACGAFLLLEDGMPLRPVGSCNVNQLFEANTGQAESMEVIRGPGTALYGANAVHAIVNVVSPTIDELAAARVGFEAGSFGLRRVQFRGATGGNDAGTGAWGSFARDDGYREASPVDDGKLNLLHQRRWRGGDLRLRLAGSVLNQETAGFVRGFDAYRDPALARSNPNPEAFRDAWSTRASASWSADAGCAGCTTDLRVMLRRSQMEFLQHFLLGKPLERNGQDSLSASALLARPWGDGDRLRWRTGLDLEVADSWLQELQAGPTLEGSPAARAIRPAGRHYDYAVSAATGAGFASLDWRLGAQLVAAASLRVDATRYDYDNRMRDGNTAEDGTPCGFGGCLYSRPADRRDRFINLTPRLALTWSASDTDRAYVAATRGFRPPEATELYRLQRQQRVAELDSERLGSVELGWRRDTPRQAWSLAAYAMAKSNVILRDADAFNVGNGRTTHRGIEYEYRLDLAQRWRLSAAGSYARHRYDFTRSVEGGETIQRGRDVDTAPRHLHRVALAWRAAARWEGELELQHVGAYFADAANLARYPGHTLANLRLAWTPVATLRTTLRVTNLADRAYADRADFAQGDWRYFPGRGRSAFLEVEYLRP